MSGPREVALPAVDRVIPIFLDVDCTLLRGYMQAPLFAHYGIDEGAFWGEVGRVTRALRAEGHEVLEETVYLDLLLNYVQRGAPGAEPPLAGLSNDLLVAMGPQLEMFPGVVEFLTMLRTFPEECARVTKESSYQQFTVDISLISTGFRKTIEGSALAPLVDRIFATEFSQMAHIPGMNGEPGTLHDTGVIQWPTYVMTHAGKTAAIHQVRKGVGLLEGRGVDDVVPREHWYCDPGNGLAFGDGASDVPMLSTMHLYGGATIGVYDEFDGPKAHAAMALGEQGRFDHVFKADYSNGSELSNRVRYLLASKMRTLLERHAAKVSRETAAAIGHVGPGSGGLANLYIPPVTPKPTQDPHGVGRANEPKEPQAPYAPSATTPEIDPPGLSFGAAYE